MKLKSWRSQTIETIKVFSMLKTAACQAELVEAELERAHVCRISTSSM